MPDTTPPDSTESPVDPLDRALPAMTRLLAVMRRLRDPNGGCPWDLEQTFATIAPHTIEEAYEVADAIERADMAHLKEELGDLLFQVVFYGQMADEAGDFDFDGVALALTEKMIARHPHVFGGDAVESATAMVDRWEQQKATERRRKASDAGQRDGVLDGVIAGLPALTRAIKLQKRAARVGFDWPDLPPVLDKLAEEIDELRAEIAGETPPERVADELGDVLFAVANLARHLDVDPEQALRGTNRKFEERFRWMEARLAEADRTPADTSLEELEDLWQASKGPRPPSGSQGKPSDG